MARVLVVNLPGGAALLGLGLLYRKRIRLDRGAAIALATWIALSVVLLVRHYACSLEAWPGGTNVSGSSACRLFVVASHHYHLYLQLAWAMLIGFVGWHALRLLLVRQTRLGWAIVLVSLIGFGVAGSWLLFTRKFDARERDLASQESGGAAIDLAAYRWILANSKADDTFATPLVAEVKDASAFAVYAAARRLVAAPLLHSSPYVLWEPRDTRRREILDAATGSGPATALCLDGAGTLWVVLPVESPVDLRRVEPVHATDRYAIYRVAKSVCARRPA